MGIIVEQNLNYSRKSNLIFNKVNCKISRGKVTAIMGRVNIISLSRAKLNQLHRKWTCYFNNGRFFTDFANTFFTDFANTNLPDGMI